MTQEIQVKVTTDHLNRVSRSAPEKAIEELIWNSLDADANNVWVNIESSELGNIKVVITDDGSGVPVDLVAAHMGQIGNSWKKTQNLTKRGRAIHGNKGEGRFKAFSLGRVVQWDTVYKKDENYYEFSIFALGDNLSSLSYSDPIPSMERKTKTIVTIEELSEKVCGSKFNTLRDKLTQVFSAHLYTYPEINIFVNNQKIDPFDKIESTVEFLLDGENVPKGSQILIIEWKDFSEKQIFLCKDNGAVLQEFNSSTRRMPNHGYSFSAYIKSKFLTNLNEESRLDLLEMDESGKGLISAAFEAIKNHFKEKKDKEAMLRIERWKSEGIYPFDGGEDIGSIETVRRELFDIVAANVENKLPKFQQSTTESKKLTFKLLSQALQDNPVAMKKIMNEVLKLTQEEQNMFANLLEKTSLQSIIKSAKIVADRLDFISALEELLFNHKNELLERDQLHKILEREAWIFDEHFALAGSEKRLEDALQVHLSLLGERGDNLSKPVLINDEKQGRIDLMFSKTVQIRPGYFDFLVVELKRPSKKIDNDVIGQIMGYAQAVRDDERFDKAKCNWKFIAVSNELDKIATMRAQNKDQPRGRIHMDDGIEIYIMPWAEVLTNAKARLKFYEEQLKYEASYESSIEYIRQVHNSFIPDSLKEI